MTTLVPISGGVTILQFPISCHQDPISCHFSRYRTRYWQYRPRYRDNIGSYPFLAIPDIANIVPDIVFFPDIGPDIGSISGHTRFLPNPISGFSPISCPIWTRYCKKYRDIRISCPKNLDIVPDVYSISQYTDVGYFRYQGVFPDIGDDISPAVLPPPACRRTGPEATVQALQLVQPLVPQLCRPMGQCLGYILAHSVLLQKTALVSDGANIIVLET